MAAGASRRFGHANKLLAPAPHRPLLARTLAGVMAATPGPVVLVTGHEARRIRRMLRAEGLVSRRLRITWNPKAGHGLSSSLDRGLTAAPRVASQLAVHLGDTPAISRARLLRLRAALHGGARAARLVHGKQPGHPVAIRRALLSRDGPPVGLQTALAAMPASQLARLPADRSVIADVDRRQMIRTLI